MRTLLLAGACAALLAQPALAEEFQFAPDDSPLYLSVGLGAKFLFLPEVNGFGGSINLNNFTHIGDPDEAYSLKAAGFGGNLTLGLNLEELDSSFLGTSRIAASVRGYSVSDNDSRAYSTGDFYSIIRVDGDGVYDLPSNGVFQMKAEAEQIAGDLMAYWDDPASGFSFGAGLTGGYSAVTYEAGEVGDSRRIVEKARTNFVGPQVSVDYALPLAERTTLYLGAKVAGLYMDGDLDARNTNGSYDIAKVSDSENWFAAEGTLSAGIEFALWGAVVARVNAEGSYLTGAPQIVNPQATLGDDIDSTQYRPAHLDQDGAFSGQVMLSISFPLAIF